MNLTYFVAEETTDLARFLKGITSRYKRKHMGKKSNYNAWKISKSYPVSKLQITDPTG